MPRGIEVIVETLDKAHSAHGCVIAFRATDDPVAEAEPVNGLQAHVIVVHREEAEWALAQSVHVLAVEHAIAHASGSRHVPHSSHADRP